MRDLDLAKQALKERNLSLVIVKAGKTLFESSCSGVRGLLQAIEALDKGLRESSVADRVVGRAAALLLASAQAREVYAAIISVEGLKVLEKNNIPVEHSMLVPMILDREGKNICPFEKFSLTIEALDRAYKQLKAFAENTGMQG